MVPLATLANILQYTTVIPTLTNLYSIGNAVIQHGKDKDLQPEPFCVVLGVAMLKTHPQGTKFGLNKYDLQLQSPQTGEQKSVVRDNFPPQGVMRWWNGDSHHDLMKLPACIFTAAGLHPPDKLPSGIDLLHQPVDSIVATYELTSITKIYLFAVDGIKQLASTYDVPINELSNPINDVEDSIQKKYLKINYLLLQEILFKGLPANGKITVLGQKVQANWKPSHFDCALEALIAMSKLPWGSEDEKMHRKSIDNLKKRKIAEFERSCKEANQLIVQDSSAPIAIPGSHPDSHTSSHSGTPLSGSLG